LAQYRGALDTALTDITTLFESEKISAAAHRLRQLDRYTEVGQHLTTPWRVVLTGRANVGKSSLINAILGYERSIVFEQPGTTRDVVTATTAIDGWPVEFADTAGLCEDGDAVESTGVALARERLAAADAVVVVFDSTKPWTAESQFLAKAWPDALVVHNKCDLAPKPTGDRPTGTRTSALTGQGIPELVKTLGSKLVPDPPRPDVAVPFSERQVAAIENAIRLLDIERPEEAWRTITRLLEGQPANALPTRNS
jgi:tRNA modification GTPase